ncbi:MAG: 2,4-dihydroxyhept-2-ene-1,7-dioic acid aldolase [Chromatiales bacterium]|nr:2,4-dihydroxyhept-2-ene-1,7-dioic acid aldolase [Chromatiales bacterium]
MSIRQQNRLFAERVRNGELLNSTMVTINAPQVSELLSDSGLDWLFIDSEHSTFDTAALQCLLQASTIPCLVRVPIAERIAIRNVLDMGAAGIIVPQVNSAKTAQEIVSWCRYPPDGIRGVGIFRGNCYGFEFEDHIKSAAQETIIVVQAEHKDAVAEIEDIASVTGIDAILIGPYDLSASYGKAGMIDDPQIQAAMDTITNACLSNNKILGFFGMNVNAVMPWIERGATLITTGVDCITLGINTRQYVTDLQSKISDK